MRLADLIPDADLLFALEPEEVAGHLLAHLNSRNDHQFHPNNFMGELIGRSDSPYRPKDDRAFRRAVMEAWSYLVREGLLSPDPEAGSHGWHYITRRGRSVASKEAFDRYQKAHLLPRALLHPNLLAKVWSAFIRGDYDVAVFQAFKEVEVAVRDASKLPTADIGSNLMRKAFDPNCGPLTDRRQPTAEREALSALFAGAIGSYKNPHSHRAVTILDPGEAVEMVMLASHLLRIVQSRVQKAAI